MRDRGRGPLPIGEDEAKIVAVARINPAEEMKCSGQL